MALCLYIEGTEVLKVTPEEIIENAEGMKAEERTMPNDPLERRVFRLETQATQNAADIAEAKDRLKNAHHRIDETQRDLSAFREETKKNFENVDKKLDNIGINMAKNAGKQKKFILILIVIGIIAVAAFCGMFIESSETRKTVGEIAGKIATATATAASVL